MSEDIDLADLKIKCKKHGATITEYLAGIINKSIHEYTDGKEPCPTWFKFHVSMHEPFEDKANFQPKNARFTIDREMKLKGNIPLAIKAAQESL